YRAVWFKVKHEGKGSAAGVWATTPHETSPIPAYKFTIPASLATGNYIVRHEILALHNAWAYPGIQSYPSCFQVTVTGSRKQIPSGSSLVIFPGAYNTDTPGVVFDMYTNPPVYPLPGPLVW
ncbi:glycoside hydrolase, partial [Tirmania nivea]